ncbi:MAG TPA: hypothetical protein VK140_02925 [Ktedonobacteraceae bacterium]|nr:hypothetical protein [Ktedonobacteraceae bacterium]
MIRRGGGGEEVGWGPLWSPACPLDPSHLPWSFAPPTHGRRKRPFPTSSPLPPLREPFFLFSSDKYKSTSSIFQ